jgi:hypothetical protein
MAIRGHPVRSDHEVRVLLQILAAAAGSWADPAPSHELLDTGFVRRDSTRADRLHLTRDGRAVLNFPVPAVC